MNIEIIKDIINLIKSEEKYSHDLLSDEEPQFSDKRYSPFPLNKNYVREFEVRDNDKKVTYIDGGNIELLSSPSFFLGLVRIYFNIFKKNKAVIPKSLPQTFEFYIFGKSVGKEKDIDFYFKLFPFSKEYKIDIEETDKTINSRDPSISNGNFRAELGLVCGIARRFLEWKVSELVIEKELENGDILVRDGSLQTAITGESNYSKKAYLAAEKKGVTFCGIAKRSRLYTSKGRSLSYAIKLLGNKVCPRKLWYYYPIAEINHPDHSAEMYYVKFHPSSRYTFRFEIEKNRAKTLQKDDIELLLGTIASNSVDIRFPGYPYGLVDADYIARIRGDEKETHKALFLSLCDDEEIIKFIDENISVEDAHDVLDSLQHM
ncbi:MAG: hypothetical protein APG12_00674 [Candidatus Methanofastidiosum methylothiophilum]|uniref:NurA domain-containing protein n=1 Tax=Candidatus Methanofastidiosum methylothiophilum TaxID=1705564 RepID=A0A150ISV3_9EURY|nr:MAG: hypothetical protein APG10_00027 [Candidatus Methanofastidiosum methylthiophilus]KYC48111.1 MAG: hypothetical protein APG11_00579 [Candidatus Methanofastidiosum methylthiophilus]KYC50650.1 MAG: hypothetical protein APG12_00674 [Candidatus Methanofastidiosum methylthiophilus]